MKRRILAAGLAAATALSLSVAPAQAAVEPAQTSSYESSSKMIHRSFERASGDQEKYNRVADRRDSLRKFLEPSSKNDLKNGYTLGTTFDILLGTALGFGVVALLAGAAQSGQLPVPKLPF
ncbi:hypothetical protein [Corynebacterium sp. Marseille-P3884]|uniref:hypothetical protein n=1 Tax=Corynebacterium sp. Marseille-P3884 TaxID=2495409 RepID=UPI001B342EE4|nr:hypothetical protein [Corynebacterium sp. Marseille-P3884]MBP3948447.1 hypothetical protein [Corynebacterium sp. Marseille-P3884]